MEPVEDVWAGARIDVTQDHRGPFFARSWAATEPSGTLGVAWHLSGAIGCQTEPEQITPDADRGDVHRRRLCHRRTLVDVAARDVRHAALDGRRRCRRRDRWSLDW